MRVYLCFKNVESFLEVSSYIIPNTISFVEVCPEERVYTWAFVIPVWIGNGSLQYF